MYNNRIYDHYQRDVVSLAVLADDDPTWQPRIHRRSLWDCTSTLNFRPAKLLNFAGREADLEASDNPFAKIVLAHLKTIQTRKTPGERATGNCTSPRDCTSAASPMTMCRSC